MSAFLAFRTAVTSLSRPHQTFTHNLYPLLLRGLQSSRSYPKNHQIEQQSPVVRLRDEDGSLHPPQSPSEILQSMDLSTHVLRLVSAHPPVVQIFTVMEDKMRQLSHKVAKKAEKQQQSRRNIVNKEIQLSWFTSGQDFEHRLAKIREELEKGDVRIDVVFNPKLNTRNPTYIEMDQQLDEVAQRMEGVGMEWRTRERKRGSATMYFQSTVKKEKTTRLTEEEIKKRVQEELEAREKQLLKKKQKEAKQREEEETEQVKE